MGTPGSGRKRTPVKDRFSAEDEALSNIAREAEARLAAKRAARAEARDIRMRELERQQKEHSHYSFDRKWGQIHKWLEDSERARYSHRSSHRRPYLGVEDALSIRSLGSHRNPSKDIIGTHWSRASTPKRKDIMYDPLKDRSSRLSSLDHSYSHSYGMKKRSSGSHKDPLSGLYFDQRNYSSLRHSKPTSAYYSRQSSSLCSDPLATSKSTRASFTANSCLLKSTSLVSLCDGGLYNPYGSRTPSEYSYYSSRISSARSSPVLDEKSDKQYAENYTRPSSRNSASATTPLSGNSSRRGSGDTSSLVDPDTSLSELRDIYDLKDQIQDVEGRYMQGLKELKESLSEVEEKYKKAMVSNAQLDNEKNNLIYQVDTLKDVIEEQEEQMAEFYRENEEKSKELERQKHMCSVLQHKMDELKEGLRQRDELIEENQRMQQKIDTMTKEVFDLQETLLWKDKNIRALEKQKEYIACLRNERDTLREELADLKETVKTGEKHGLVIIPDGTPNGDVNHEPVVGAITVVSQEAAQVLESAGEGPLDVRLRKLAGEKEELLSQIRRLKLQLEEERQKCSRSENAAADLAGLHNGSDLQFIEMQRDANRQISEYKFKLSKAEQDITTLEQNISRLEGQVLRYKTAAENAEKVEDELKAEKRKLQRELRTALDKIEEMEMTNSHLAKRLEKMKANRTALLAQQ
ncbi:leucine-rich repeat flightless-interacting protein 2 isoform X14 [Canis lupus baileyi]|uniref:leucine-rich repeat flightless-interacting protein 2 isoform X12 n=1 Tax=Canis lupus familiaris TaxID=9615 RepID=UPI0006B3C29A|nr:leucine-rich repeat flightless-interacting protein 2 isoform X12 [Canis lupus familiaris]XP_025317136.1 leucine-rich repeat flightless-interacting protein 2 isoform X15 [Canis lupus dingo]XP_038287764.1 leucine-rich repeat flightless-interacting protein 2 isoform X12 [Canis lupus familiaris]XP_038426316.1 leucine-rich repeat flightless-interacting protein 2 isoform X12 [Canis lupus familiaris]|eukprot:XP_013962041.1 leucine-rich repeat flightless-interacting protein 2 isoform X13 [Canis lupus familiaris]